MTSQSVPISPGFHALVSAASEAMEAAAAPTAPPSLSLALQTAAAQHAATVASPAQSQHTSLINSPAVTAAFLATSPPSSAQKPRHSLTGMSILQNPSGRSLLTPPKPPNSVSPSPIVDDTDNHSAGSNDDNQSFGSTGSSVSTATVSGSAGGDQSVRSPLQQPQPISSGLSLFTQSVSLPSSSPPLHSHSSALYTPNKVLPPHSSPPLSASSPRRSSMTGSPLLSHMKGPRRGSHASLSLNANVSFRQSKKVSSLGGSGESSGGSSCHQCKSRRSFGDLTYCTSSLHKKNKNAICRKKYCDHCLKKFYRENSAPAGTAGSTVWKCPSCRKICCCAACRRREMRESGGSLSHLPTMNGMDGGANGEVNGLVLLNSVSSSPHHRSLLPDDVIDEVDSDGEDARMSPMDQTPFDRSPSPININGLRLSPNTPQLAALEKLPAPALHNHSIIHGANTHNNNDSGSNNNRTLLSVSHHSPALTALSQAASKLSNSDFLFSHKPKSIANGGGDSGGWYGVSLNHRSSPMQIGMTVNGLDGHSHRRRERQYHSHASGSSDQSNSDDDDSSDDDDDNANFSLTQNDTGNHHIHTHIMEGPEDSSENENSKPSKSIKIEQSLSSPTAISSALLSLPFHSLKSPINDSERQSPIPFALPLVLALSQLPSIQSGVQSILRQPDASNAVKLQEIDQLLREVAAKVESDELSLTIP